MPKSNEGLKKIIVNITHQPNFGKYAEYQRIFGLNLGLLKRNYTIFFCFYSNGGREDGLIHSLLRMTYTCFDTYVMNFIAG